MDTIMDHELLRNLMDKHGLTIRTLAIRAGFATSTIHGYMSDNGANPPLAVWTALFQLTADLLIPRMILQGTPWGVVRTLREDIVDAAGGLGALCKVVMRHMQACEAFLKVWQDGQVTVDEASGVEQFEGHAMEATAGLIALMNETRAALNRATATVRKNN